MGSEMCIRDRDCITGQHCQSSAPSRQGVPPSRSRLAPSHVPRRVWCPPVAHPRRRTPTSSHAHVVAQLPRTAPTAMPTRPRTALHTPTVTSRPPHRTALPLPSQSSAREVAHQDPAPNGGCQSSCRTVNHNATHWLGGDPLRGTPARKRGPVKGHANSETGTRSRARRKGPRRRYKWKPRGCSPKAPRHEADGTSDSHEAASRRPFYTRGRRYK